MLALGAAIMLCIGCDQVPENAPGTETTRSDSAGAPADTTTKGSADTSTKTIPTKQLETFERTSAQPPGIRGIPRPRK